MSVQTLVQVYEVKVYADGTKYWYQDGKLHRLDGPAIEWADGSKYWYQDGKCHRLDGPAVEYADGLKCWYQDGKQVPEPKPILSCAGRIVEIDGRKYELKEV